MKINEDFIRKLRIRAFEYFCFYLYTHLGKWQVEQDFSPNVDGANFLLRKPKSHTLLALLRCVSEENSSIDEKCVLDTLEAVKRTAAPKSILLTNGFITKNALKTAEKSNVRIYTTKKIFSLYQLLPPGRKRELRSIIAGNGAKPPLCLTCGSKMIPREIKYGTFPSERFWICINFPKCRMSLDFPFADPNKNKNHSNHTLNGRDNSQHSQNSAPPTEKVSTLNNTMEKCNSNFSRKPCHSVRKIAISLCAVICGFFLLFLVSHKHQTDNIFLEASTSSHLLLNNN